MLGEKKVTIEEVDKKLKNIEEEFESYQYFVNKKIGRESGYISTDKMPGARTYDAIIDVNGRGDFRTIQEALDAGKKNIFIRAGTYRLTKSIKISSNYVSLIGDPSGDVRLEMRASSTTPIISMDSDIYPDPFDYITIEHIKFYNPSTDASLNASIGINLDYGTRYLKIKNCSFFQLGSHGILLGDSSDTQYRGATDVEITGCEFYDCGGAGIKIYNGSNITISQNNIRHCSSYGIMFNLSGFGKITRNQISYNEDNQVHLENESTKSIITSNIVNAATYSDYCIREDSTDDDYNIIANNITENASTANISTQGSNTIKSNNIE